MHLPGVEAWNFYITDRFFFSLTYTTTIKSAAFNLVSSWIREIFFFFFTSTLRFTLPTKRLYNHLISFVRTIRGVEEWKGGSPFDELAFSGTTTHTRKVLI